MTVVYFKKYSSARVGLECTSHGRIDFYDLGGKFKLDPGTIDLNGVRFPRRGLLSASTWEQIKAHFKEEGKPVGAEDDPVVVTGHWV